jgi:DNA repair protein RecN (Recombination protein N)
MLRTLRIQSYALIDDLTIDFAPDLNVLTGETGAGKSIILGALSLVLGEKADADVIRTGKESAVIEAVFAPRAGPRALAGILSELALDEPPGQEGLGELAHPHLIIRRKITRTGKGNCVVNDGAVSNLTLRRLGDMLVDLHGQHEHQSLLNRDLHGQVLDDFAGLTSERQQLAVRFRAYRTAEAELKSRCTEARARRERRDLTEFQFKELQAARLVPGEIETLHKEKELLDSAEKRLTLAREVTEILAEGEGSVQEQLSSVVRRLETLVQLDGRLGAGLGDLKQASSVLDDLWRSILDYRERIEVAPGRLDEINERLYALEKLIRKYCGVGRGHDSASCPLPGLERSTIEGLTRERDRLGQELAAQESDESRIHELEAELETLAAELTKAARQLSAARRKGKGQLERSVYREFGGLGLARARISVALSRQEDPDGIYTEEGKRYRLDENGADDVEFMFSANPGEELKSLRKVASGGELSRIMLTLKGALSAQDQVPVMVFDEIDVGIGGRIAEAVGRKLADIAQKRQVICITHLAQIARFADTHFLVTKSTQAGRTVTRIAQLSQAERVDEIARMLTGTEVTKTALAHARELLHNG